MSKRLTVTRGRYPTTGSCGRGGRRASRPWALFAIPILLATGVQAGGDTESGAAQLSVSQRTFAAGPGTGGDVPEPLRLPLPSLLGPPPTWATGAAAAGVSMAAGDQSESQSEMPEAQTAPAKSPGKALFLSALVPGAGEYYAGSRKRAAVFFGLEVLGWALWSSWNSKGDDIEEEFRSTARAEWDPQSYIGWRISSRSRFSSLTHALPCSVNVVNDGTDGLGDCPESELQQYYELIGKYDQFVSGWSDLTDDNGSPVQPSAVDSVESFHSAIRFEYEDRRDDSNKYLERASTMAGLILVNHVLSAIDASRVARQTAAGKDAAAIDSRTRFAFMTQRGLRGGAPMLLAYKPIY